MKKKVAVLCVGSGWVVQNRHLPILMASPFFDVRGIAGRDQESLKKTSQHYHIPSYDVDGALLSAECLKGCDAVIIGTDPANHFTIAHQALRHGKHVLVEKPMTLSIEESQILVQAAKENNVTCAVIHNFQFSSASKQMDRDVAQGKLGHLVGISAFQWSCPDRRLPSWYESLPWGLFYDESPHFFYLLEKYGKNISPLSVQKWNSLFGRKTPSFVTAHFTSESNVPIHLSVNFEAPLSEWFFILIGERGVGAMDLFRDSYYFIPHDGRHAPLDILRTSFFVGVGHIGGTIVGGIKFLRGKYFVGNQEVFERFAKNVLYGEPLGEIDCSFGLRINAIQHEVINTAIAI